MIFIFHDRKRVTKVFDFDKDQALSSDRRSIQEHLFEIAATKRTGFVFWCHEDLENNINHDAFARIFHHDLIMASYSTSGAYCLSTGIGYIENAPFINVKPDISYSSWLMSSDIGGIGTQVLNQFQTLVNQKTSFDLFLNNLSKHSIKLGLFCYSEPQLLVREELKPISPPKKESLSIFAKNHYRKRWSFVLFFNYLVYEKRFKVLELFRALFAARLPRTKVDLSKIEVRSTTSHQGLDRSYDVLIPTLGRADVLKDVLRDLSKQTVVPKMVIIIEQNAMPDSESELHYLKDNEWPFEIDHTFTHQLGACNARNIALEKVQSEWVFFADDDIRLGNRIIDNAFNFISQYGLKAVNMAVLQKDEVLIQEIPIQWHSFGSGCSFIASKVVKDLRFGMEHEFGFGEDADFGMKIRNTGTDIIYFPNEDFLHLKAPSGGFREKISLPWDNEKLSPKPSPTVFAFWLKHLYKEQILGKKTLLFFKFYKLQPNKNPITYFWQMSKRWDLSKHWAEKLIKKYS